MFRFACLFGASLLLPPTAAWAQPAVPVLARPVTGRTQFGPYPPPPADTVRARTVAEAFGRGHWHGHLRNYSMATKWIYTS